MVAARIGPAIIELAVRPGGLKCRELDVLEFKTHFEGVLPVSLAEIVGHLNRVVDFIGREESIRPERAERVEGKRRQSAVLSHLRDITVSVASARAARSTSGSILIGAGETSA